jgi:hypothetical protein
LECTWTGTWDYISLFNAREFEFLEALMDRRRIGEWFEMI